MVDRSSRQFKQTANIPSPSCNGENRSGSCNQESRNATMNRNSCNGNCNRENNNVSMNRSNCDRENNGRNIEQNACKALLHRLQALDFSIIDTVLYLNAYPNSCEALAYYQKLVAERDALKNGMAQTCHSPVTNFENASSENWDWINGPWPWEASAN